MVEKKLKTIKSFVRRQGRITESQQKALDRLWPQYGLEVGEGFLNSDKFFGSDHDVVLEIGFGMGEALLSTAMQHPENNYIGVEVHGPGVGSLLLRIEQFQIKNIRIFRADVNEVFTCCIPDNSLSQIHIFFPDPWPKLKHRKRRLIQPVFVDLLWHKLKLGGKVHLATDWQDYALQMMKVFSEHEGFNNLAGRGLFLQKQTLRAATKFEQRGQRLGHGVWDMIFYKRSVS